MRRTRQRGSGLTWFVTCSGIENVLGAGYCVVAPIIAFTAHAIFCALPAWMLVRSDLNGVQGRSLRIYILIWRSRENDVINGAGHELRHDPRAVAVLLGWLGRQQITAQVAS